MVLIDVVDKSQRLGWRTGASTCCYLPGPLQAGRVLHEVSTMAALRAFARWIGDSIGHAFGNPREEHATLPPNVGVQPYRDQPNRR
jgi:hypothetical protein